jgi:4-hydroxy-tetrahydrodipicolinate reductase
LNEKRGFDKLSANGGKLARIGIIGSEGRMGHALVRAIEAAGHEVAGGVDKGGDVASLADHSDVLLDFSAPFAIDANLHAAIGAGIPILIGTTGIEEAHHAAIDAASRAIAVLQTGNTSLGVTLLGYLVREAASRLGPEWDVEVLEMHHRMKVDAPSGTALLLGEAAAEGREIDLAENSERGRDGLTGAREPGTIGFASLRGGTVAGDHTVIFAGQQERLTLSHSAEDRMIFAHGAARGAAWLIGREPGRYTMGQVLGL